MQEPLARKIRRLSQWFEKKGEAHDPLTWVYAWHHPPAPVLAAAACGAWGVVMDYSSNALFTIQLSY